MQYGLSDQFADELPFIREILFDVQDDAPRWIYADWLEERGNPREQFDGQTMPLLEAMDQTTKAGFGTIISCVAGKLAYYFDEEGERRAILERKPGK